MQTCYRVPVNKPLMRVLTLGRANDVAQQFGRADEFRLQQWQ